MLALVKQHHLHALLGVMDGLELLSNLLQHLPWKGGVGLSQRDLQTPLGLDDVLSSRFKRAPCMHVPTLQLAVCCMHMAGPVVQTASTDAMGWSKTAFTKTCTLACMCNAANTVKFAMAEHSGEKVSAAHLNCCSVQPAECGLLPPPEHSCLAGQVSMAWQGCGPCYRGHCFCADLKRPP